MVNALNGPADTYTLNQFIALQDKDEITYKNFSILEQSASAADTYYSISNVINEYLDDLDDIIKTVSVTDSQRDKYMYKPKLLAYDIYDSSEMFFILLALNGMHNIKSFDLHDMEFKALTVKDMEAFTTKVYNANESYILLNRKSLGLV